MCQITLSDWNYLSIQKKELVSFMKNTRDKEEYRRASAIKQKTEGIPYRTIARNVGVNYRNVYDWINNYRKSGLDGIRNKRKNGGRKPVISTYRNKEMVKDIVLNKSSKNIWLSQEYLEYQTFGYLSHITIGNECQSYADMEDNSGFRHCMQTDQNLNWKKASIMRKRRTR